MRTGGSSKGYTIVEVMIVLAVSGVMFISAMSLINGKQDRTEFTTAVRDFASILNADAMNVSNGYYSTVKNWTCTVTLKGTASTPPTVKVSQDVTGGQGTHDGCMYIGQVMRLPVPAMPANAENYDVTPLVGAQYKAGDPTTKQFSQTAIDSGDTPITGATQTAQVGNGVTIGCVLYATLASAPSLLGDTSTTPCASPPSSYKTTNALTFLTTFYGVTTQGDPTGTASSQVNLVVPVNTSTDPLAVNVFAFPSTYESSPAGGVYICLQSGTTNQHAMIGLGGNSSQFATQSLTYTGGC